MSIGALGKWAIALTLGMVCSAPSRAGAGGVADRCASLAEEGQDLRAARRLAEARARFTDCARSECPAVVRSDCSRWQGEVAESEPTVVFGARASGNEDVTQVRVSVDGALLVDHLDGKAVGVDPGAHVFRFEREGAPPVERRVLIREGEKNRLLAIEWPPPAAPDAKREATAPSAQTAPPLSETPPTVRPSPRDYTWAYLLGAIAVASLGASAVLEVRGVSDWNDLRSGCGASGTCSSSQKSSVEREIWAGNVAFFVGVAALGGATWVVLAQAKKPGVALRVVPRTNGASASLSASF
jgi:hypothetical protein